MWENLIGRSRSFWTFLYPVLRSHFPSFWDVDLETFYRAINAVKPCLIRVDSNEVTYNLHILHRFELEYAFVAGDLQVNDLPQAFADMMEEYIGVRPPDLVQGALQDTHWASGLIGYYPTYMLGNLAAAQFFVHYCVLEYENIQKRFAAGDFSDLLGWLRENVHRWGFPDTLQGLLTNVTGEQLSPLHFFGYLEEKFGELYEL